MGACDLGALLQHEVTMAALSWCSTPWSSIFSLSLGVKRELLEATCNYNVNDLESVVLVWVPPERFKPTKFIWKGQETPIWW